MTVGLTDRRIDGKPRHLYCTSLKQGQQKGRISRATKSLRMYVFKRSLTTQPYGFFSHDIPILKNPVDPTQAVFKS